MLGLCTRTVLNSEGAALVGGYREQCARKLKPTSHHRAAAVRSRPFALGRGVRALLFRWAGSPFPSQSVGGGGAEGHRPYGRGMRFLHTVLCFVVITALHVTVAQSMSIQARSEALEAVIQIVPYDWDADAFYGAGSGTIISSSGYVLTNAHVVVDEEGNPLELLPVFITDPKRPTEEAQFAYLAGLVDFDRELDLALLKIVMDAQFQYLPEDAVFPHAPVGTIEGMQLGDSVFVIGFPGVSGNTITYTGGVISGFLGADLSGGGNAWVKTDARMGHGNSGGGAFDQAGTLVGIPTLRRTRPTGDTQDLFRPINYAYQMIEANIPLDTVQIGPRPESRGSETGPAPMPTVPRLGGATIRSGASVEGALDLLDSHYFPERIAHAFTLTVAKPGEIEVAVRSSDFDAYVVVLSPDGRALLEVDDSPGYGFNVAERFRVSEAGLYSVIVTTALPREAGAYVFTLSSGDDVGGVNVARTEVPTGPAGATDASYSGYWSGYLLDTQGGRGAVVALLQQSGSFGVDGVWEATFDWGVTSGTITGLIQTEGLFLELYPHDKTACPFSGLAKLSGYTIAGEYDAFGCSVPISGLVSLTKRGDR